MKVIENVKPSLKLHNLRNTNRLSFTFFFLGKSFRLKSETRSYQQISYMQGCILSWCTIYMLQLFSSCKNKRRKKKEYSAAWWCLFISQLCQMPAVSNLTFHTNGNRVFKWYLNMTWTHRDKNKELTLNNLCLITN